MACMSALPEPALPISQSRSADPELFPTPAAAYRAALDLATQHNIGKLLPEIRAALAALAGNLPIPVTPSAIAALNEAAKMD